MLIIVDNMHVLRRHSCPLFGNGVMVISEDKEPLVECDYFLFLQKYLEESSVLDIGYNIMIKELLDVERQCGQGLDLG